MAVVLIMVYKNNQQDNFLKEISINGKDLQVEIADTPAKHSHGLSDRESLCQGCGMLFVFDELVSPSFWMKDMNFSLDIIWVRDGRVIGVSSGLPPLKPNEKPVYYHPPEQVNYVIEVNAGWADENKIKAGDVVKL